MLQWMQADWKIHPFFRANHKGGMKMKTKIRVCETNVSETDVELIRPSDMSQDEFLDLINDVGSDNKYNTSEELIEVLKGHGVIVSNVEPIPSWSGDLEIRDIEEMDNEEDNEELEQIS